MIALLNFVEALRQRGCDFRILSGSCPIDTTTASGRLLFHISAALAENERDVIRERTIAGLASARARGRKDGRPAKLTAKHVGTARRAGGAGRVPAIERYGSDMIPWDAEKVRVAISGETVSWSTPSSRARSLSRAGTNAA
jgi:DNA invertase Pin-like site-specific DNA recombinase